MVLPNARLKLTICNQTRATDITTSTNEQDKNSGNSPARLLLFVFAWFSGCQPKARVRTATEKHYELKGKVVSVEKDKHVATIAHEDIADYMPGMTMPFTIEDEGGLQILAPGSDYGDAGCRRPKVVSRDLVITKESTEGASATTSAGRWAEAGRRECPTTVS